MLDLLRMCSQVWRYKNPHAKFGGEGSEGTVSLAPKVLENNARPLEAGRIVESYNTDDISLTTTVQFSG